MHPVNQNTPSEDEPRHYDALTADAALVAMCLWMHGLQVELASAVDELFAEAEEAQRETVTINGRAYMRYANLIPLRILKGLTLDHRTDPRFTEARRVFEAVERGDWFEIDGIERAGVMLSSEGRGDNAEQ